MNRSQHQPYDNSPDKTSPANVDGHRISAETPRSPRDGHWLASVRPRRTRR
jgi:hypothetical protein